MSTLFSTASQFPLTPDSEAQGPSEMMNSSKKPDFKVFIVPSKRLSEVEFKILPGPLEIEFSKFSILGGGEG